MYKRQVLTLRVRMPIVADLTYARNFITKIIKYDKVCATAACYSCVCHSCVCYSCVRCSCVPKQHRPVERSQQRTEAEIVCQTNSLSTHIVTHTACVTTTSRTR